MYDKTQLEKQSPAAVSSERESDSVCLSLCRHMQKISLDMLNTNHTFKSLTDFLWWHLVSTLYSVNIKPTRWQVQNSQWEKNCLFAKIISEGCAVKGTNIFVHAIFICCIIYNIQLSHKQKSDFYYKYCEPRSAAEWEKHPAALQYNV